MTTLDDFLENKAEIEQLEDIISSGKITSCLVYGSTGCGKSTLIGMLKKKFSDTIHAVDCEKLAISQLEEIKNGNHTPYTIEDYFSGNIHKRPVIFIDDIENMSISKTFFKNTKVLTIATADMTSFRQQKERFSILIKIEKPSFKSFGKIIKEKYPEIPDSINCKDLCSFQMNDIRGMLQQLDIGGDLNPKCKDNTLLRDPCEDTIAILNRALTTYNNIGKFNTTNVNSLEGDKYNCLFLLYENYLNWVKEDEYLNAVEFFSSMDIKGLDYSENDFITHHTTMGIISKLNKIHKRFRPSKLISRKNQTVINKNRTTYSKRKFLPYCEHQDLYLVCKILKTDTDKNLIWLRKQFKL